MKGFLPIFIYIFIGVIQSGFSQSQVQPTAHQNSILDSINKYGRLGQCDKVMRIAEQWATQLRKDHKETTADYGAALQSWGNCLCRTGNLKEGESKLLNSLAVQRKAIGESNQDVAKTMLLLGIAYIDLADYHKADSFLNQALQIRRKVLGDGHPLVAQTLHKLGTICIELGQLAKAETYYLNALEINKNALGDKHLETGASYNQLGGLYWTQSEYKKAEPLYQKALEIFRNTLGENHMNIGVILNNLGTVYLEFGEYQKAENCYLKGLDIVRKAMGESHFYNATCLDNLGNYYDAMGDKAKAESYHQKALDIRILALGEQHPEVAMSCHNLASVYIDRNQNQKAEKLLLKSLEIRKKTYGDVHILVGSTLQNLGVVYLKSEQVLRSESFHLNALNTIRKASNKPTNFETETLTALGIFYSETGQYPKAESYLQQSLEMQKLLHLSEHQDFNFTQSLLGELYLKQRNFVKAGKCFLEWNQSKQNDFKRYFPFLSDQEKEKYFETRFSPGQELFKTFCVLRYQSFPEIAGDLYNNQLATKGLLLNSSAKWKHRIKTAGDIKLNRLFDEWTVFQNKLNKLLKSSDSTERAGLDSVRAKAEKMEKELSLRSENFSKLADKKLISWKEVQKNLKAGEAAIELVRLKKFGLAKTMTDTSDPKKPSFRVLGLTDTIQYAALIIKPESLIPEMVLLENGNELEGKHLRYYRNSITNQIRDEKSYQQFWERIGSKLGNSKRIFLSPDGVYHNINLNTLFNPKTKKYLLEEKDILLVTTTKDRVNPSPVEEENKLAELVGFPQYYQTTSAMTIASSARKSPDMTYGIRLESMGTLAELPGTKTEVNNIASILEEKGWEVKNYTGVLAIEENIKESYKPRLLHIATHGFFQPDSTKGSNPLLRSGLMLSGAGSTLKGEKNEGEDGILTAFEAMNLNLDNTDLVVLSACETGLGEVKNGEGVYGLQRAFKVAGAKTIIMSLWKVDDEATRELMVGFYKNWLSNRTDSSQLSVRSKRQAFLLAQKELKAKYPDPYYWGAFVMVGE